MKKNKDIEENERSVAQIYAAFFEEITSLLHLPLTEIENKYHDTVHSQRDYSEDESTGKLLEIRLEEKEITMNCLFNSEEKCNRIYLFPDRPETIVVIVFQLVRNFSYDYLENRWIGGGYFITTLKISKQPNDYCMLLYCKDEK